jgi:hypothetical protein
MYVYCLSIGKDPTHLDPALVEREGRKIIAASLLQGFVVNVPELDQLDQLDV